MIRRWFMYVSTLLSVLMSLSTPVNAAITKTDFNGDGQADLFLQNIFTGNLSAWLINGSQVLQKITYGTVAPSSGWTPLGIKDVNGDGRTDLFWYNTNTGEVLAWIINGASVLQAVSYGTVAPATGWIPAGLEDFNGDGRADLLWYNGYTGEVASWLLSGGTVLQVGAYGVADRNQGWTPLGIKDANGDGRADLFWYNTNSGSVVAWLIDGGSVLQSMFSGAVAPATGWIPAGLEDFNGDGRADLLWYNGYTGEVASWLLSGGTFLQLGSYGTVALSTGWTPIGIKDANGDGRGDLLWYNTNSGGVVAWLINGASLLQSVSYGTVAPSSGWAPIGFDDFNGDGRIDLLWQNTFSNATVAWLLNGNGVLQTADYGSVPPSSVWQIKIPR